MTQLDNADASDPREAPALSPVVYTDWHGNVARSSSAIDRTAKLEAPQSDF
ncbi:hypothetical protein [Actibacterium sp. 188UL27-1]|uniref:hypothetical protein n=1 Tax=Actibacterium sp. 188UL27-1 TaxID=2786961 RepID=UPI001958A956|nr:hypothetical protein [Actibacterium sp. 188UL27-1]MBM7067672.1 hypothetical protein [Actibacterium sp. 188UL27-1]